MAKKTIIQSKTPLSRDTIKAQPRKKKITPIKKIVGTISQAKQPRDPYRFLTVNKGIFSLKTDSVFVSKGDDDIKKKWDYYMANGYVIDYMLTMKENSVLICFIKEN